MLREQVAVDLVLAAGRARPRASRSARRPRGWRPRRTGRSRRGRTSQRVREVDVEAVAPAGLGLRGGERDADARRAPAADVVQQRPPAAAEVEHPPAGRDPDLLGDVVVLAALGLLERQREVAVVLGPAEVGHLAQAEAEDAVDQRVGEVEVARSAMVLGGARPSAGAGVAERDQPAPLLVPQLEPHGPQAVPQRERRHVVEDRVLVVRALQVVVRDPGAQVVDVVQADVAGEELEDLRQLQVRAARAAPRRRSSTRPVLSQ